MCNRTCLIRSMWSVPAFIILCVVYYHAASWQRGCGNAEDEESGPT